jgi:hypothetical protein
MTSKMHLEMAEVLVTADTLTETASRLMVDNLTKVNLFTRWQNEY